MKDIDCTVYQSPRVIEHHEDGTLKKQSLNWDLLDEQLEQIRSAKALLLTDCKVRLVWRRMEAELEFDAEGYYIVHELKFS